ncbi:MAG: 23S rRNA (guanosine(2251)-2'-O)-methyltransferase RlmB [Elusimicrobiota bacterium]|jgi:23S rRNA (guanosine2251-2'-O)-methyltransferase|nr:23S rRNA (guanosine(2251)-2'-O)-methyltransferase RlmB [Elusimicrobiota bacterium]
MEKINKGELLFGIHPIREALKNRKRPILQLYILENKRPSRQVEEVIRLAKANNVKIKTMEERLLDNLVNGQNHQGVVARAEPMQTMRLSNAIYEAAGKKQELWLAIDEVTDPQNLGSLLRSAACLGFSTVILPQRRTVGITPTVHKVASGAVETLKIVEVTNLTTAILDLKDEGFWIYGADMDGKELPKVDYAYPAVLIIGAEGTGLREKTKEHCDEVISVPQQGGVSSLNAAAAGAIIMYDMYSKMKFK